ncbi:hypothetical protein [Alienimonas chondri]|uniref:hypothetical protein n=1 Tax=Alienimonas chondri TaxID=2681879 RepID=UPI001487F2C0|nr:hypothetical protein [Alienimonas chondri]
MTFPSWTASLSEAPVYSGGSRWRCLRKAGSILSLLKTITKDPPGQNAGRGEPVVAGQRLRQPLFQQSFDDPQVVGDLLAPPAACQRLACW